VFLWRVRTYEVDCVPQNTPTIRNVPPKKRRMYGFSAYVYSKINGQKKLYFYVTKLWSDKVVVVLDSTRDAFLVVELQAKRTQEDTRSMSMAKFMHIRMKLPPTYS
jgi:hypothetical protein